MKKILVLLVVLCLTGCNVEYNLIITEDEFQEQVVIDENDIDFPITVYSDQEGTGEGKVDGVLYYDIETTDTSSILRHTFNSLDYERSHAANTCFNRFLVNEEDGVMTILSSNYYNCMDYYSSLDTIKVQVKLDTNIYEIVNQNADQIDGSTYIWNINKSNYQDHYVYLSYQKKGSNTCDIVSCDEDEELVNPNSEDCYCKKKSAENDKEVEEENVLFDYILLGGILLLFVIAIVGLIKYKSIHD